MGTISDVDPDFNALLPAWLLDNPHPDSYN
jgi:hypothetical protein